MVTTKDTKFMFLLCVLSALCGEYKKTYSVHIDDLPFALFRWRPG
jgi:hypothetical protein